MNAYMFQNRQVHFVASFVLAVFIVCMQSIFFAKISSPWLRIDFVTIFVVYVAIEHYPASALVKIMAAALLMQTFSSVPSGFYVMYFLLALVLSGFLSRRLVLYNRLSQFLSFAGIFILKFVLLYFALARQIKGHFFSDFFVTIYPSLLSTILVAVPCFWLLSSFDEMFAFYTLKDRQKEIEI